MRELRKVLELEIRVQKGVIGVDQREAHALSIRWAKAREGLRSDTLKEWLEEAGKYRSKRGKRMGGLRGSAEKEEKKSGEGEVAQY